MARGPSPTPGSPGRMAWDGAWCPQGSGAVPTLSPNPDMCLSALARRGLETMLASPSKSRHMLCAQAGPGRWMWREVRLTEGLTLPSATGGGLDAVAGRAPPKAEASREGPQGDLGPGLTWGRRARCTESRTCGLGAAHTGPRSFRATSILAGPGEGSLRAVEPLWRAGAVGGIRAPTPHQALGAAGRVSQAWAGAGLGHPASVRPGAGRAGG